MKLTETQIEELYKFTRKHYVEHYDVQTELVDHLANDIEDICTENPSLSFDKARDTSFKKFGVFGFMNVVEAKQKQMNKRYLKIMWRFLKEWFTFPKVATTLGLFLLFFCILKMPYAKYILLSLLFILVVIDLRRQTIARKKQKIKTKKVEKTFLLEDLISGARNSFSGLLFINVFNSMNAFRVSFNSMENHWLLLVSFSITVVLLMFYITGFLIPKKSEELLAETYPEYKMVK